MATYYWVGGTGTWDSSSTTNWSLTSGGSGGAGVPTSSDNVVFDNNSGGSGSTVTLDFFTPPVAANFTYTSGNIDFSGTQLTIHGSFTASVAFPGIGFSVGTLNMQVKTTTGTSISSVSSLGRIDLYNVVSPAGQATINVNSTLNCQRLFSDAVSIAASIYEITCTSLLLENSSGGTFAKTLGTVGSTLNITITSTGSPIVAFDTSAWGGASDRFDGLTITMKNGWSGTSLNSGPGSGFNEKLLFNLIIDNTICGDSTFGRGIDNFTIKNSGSLSIDQSFSVFGFISIFSSGSISATSNSYTATLRKKTGSPVTGRVVQVVGFENWKSLGLINSAFGGSGTDVITVSGSLGSSTFPMGTFEPRTGSISTFTSIYAVNVSLVSGVSINSSSALLVSGTFTVASGAVIGGSPGWYVEADTAVLDTNGVSIPKIIAYGGSGNGCTVSSNLLVDELYILGRTSKGTTTFEAYPGVTVTASTVLFVSGINAVDRVALAPYRFAGPSAWNLVKSSGTVSASFATISYNNASGGAKFEAFPVNGNVNGGNNTGWIFNAGTGNFFMFL